MSSNLFNKSSETTDWLIESDQQFWFDQFKSPNVDGLKFDKFKDFLNVTIYRYIKSFPNVAERATSNDDHNDSCQFSYQQEMQLFKTFDHKNDHLLDFEEFSSMCHRWLDKVFRPACALIIVDVQNDFIDGSLALINGPARQDGADVLPVINHLLESNYFKTVVYTQDWHPIDHICFHANLHLRKYKPKSTDLDIKSKDLSTSEKKNGESQEIQANMVNEPLKYKKMNPSVKLFDTVLFDDGRMEQKLWPTHCVQNSWGAQLHPKLKIVKDAVYIQKGSLPNVDAYSAFWDNRRLNETGLRHELLSRKISDLYICGLALDYCVAASAIDSAKAGFITFVIEDACRGINIDDIARRRLEMTEHGVLIVNSKFVSTMMDSSGEFDGSNREYDSSITKSEQSNFKGIIDRQIIKSICFRRGLI